jgi:hypothetical protein
VATSNFTGTLDSAFLSRSDTAILVPLPTVPAVAQILAVTLRDFAVLDPALGQLAESAQLLRVATLLDGVDGRQARKFITEAMSRRLETVLNPGVLTEADLIAAAEDWADMRTGFGRQDACDAAA